jgi:hypothetical protein
MYIFLLVLINFCLYSSATTIVKVICKGVACVRQWRTQAHIDSLSEKLVANIKKNRTNFRKHIYYIEAILIY